MVMVNVCRNMLLLAEMLYCVEFNSIVITPDSTPLVRLKSRPSGKSGVINQEETFPPKICGSR